MAIWRTGLLVGLCLALLTLPCPASPQLGPQDLQRALDLYNAGNYARAHGALVKIDPAGLTESQRAVRDDYLDRTQRMIGMPVQSRRSSGEARPSGSQAGPTVTAASLVDHPGIRPESPRRRQRDGQTERPESRSGRQFQQGASQAPVRVGFPPGTTFGEAVDRIAENTGLNIFVNWPLLEQVGVTPQQEVSLRPMRNVTWRKTLEMILQQVSASLGGTATLDWAIEEGVLMISTRDDLNTRLRVRVYDIGDLLVPRRVVPRNQGSQTTTGITGSGTSGGLGLGGVSSTTSGGLFGQ